MFWIKATRPWALPASIMPVVLAAAYLFFLQQTEGIFVDWQWLPLVLIAVVCYHLGLNMVSDFYDFKMGVDHALLPGYQSPLVKGEVSEKKWKIVAGSILGFGTGVGFLLTFQCGYHLLWIGGIGLIAGYFYHIFKKYTLGDVLIFVLFGVLTVQGTFYVLTSELSVTALLLSIPVGLITTAIIHANYTRDRVHDLQAGVRSQASIVGLRIAQWEYVGLISGAYLAIIALVIFEVLPYLSLPVLLTFPVGLKNVKTMFKASQENVEPILVLDEETAKLQLIFTSILSLLIFISPFVR